MTPELFSSSPQAFPIIWCRRNGIDYHSSTLSCPVRPPPLTPHFPSLFIHESFYLVFCLPLRLFPGIGASSTCPSSLLCIFSVIVFLLVLHVCFWFYVSSDSTHPELCSNISLLLLNVIVSLCYIHVFSAVKPWFTVTSQSLVRSRRHYRQLCSVPHHFHSEKELDVSLWQYGHLSIMVTFGQPVGDHSSELQLYDEQAFRKIDYISKLDYFPCLLSFQLQLMCAMCMLSLCWIHDTVKCNYADLK